MRHGLRILLAASVLTTLTVLGGVLVGGPTSEAPTTGSPSADGPRSGAPADEPAVVPADLGVQRTAFCAAVPEAETTAALGEPVASTDTWANGERTRLTGDVTDVAHEYGCTWRSRQATVSAWVFAPPVTSEQAARLVSDAADRDGCRRVESPAYGDPGAALLCERSGRAEASYRGLFGDAWLTCTLLPSVADDGGADSLTARAGRWCAAVATAAAGEVGSTVAG